MSDTYQPLTPMQQALMTHQAQQPNPAQPYIDATNQGVGVLSQFLSHGLQGTGVLPGWLNQNPVQQALQNPDNQAAMGGLTLKNTWTTPSGVDEAAERHVAVNSCEPELDGRSLTLRPFD